jgi:hypothetical protein
MRFGSYYLFLQPPRWSTFIRNVGVYLQIHTVSEPEDQHQKRQQILHALLTHYLQNAHTDNTETKTSTGNVRVPHLYSQQNATQK